MKSKLPNIGTNIFSTMTALATKHQAINLAQGFPNFAPSEKLQDLVHHAMRQGYNQYAPMPGHLGLREAIAQKIDILYGISVNPETEITITAGATQAIFTIISALVHSGDEVILIEPCYDSYQPSIEVAGGSAVAYQLSAPNYQVDWNVVRSLITPKTRLIITNTPNNPTGQVFSQTDLLALEAMLKDTNVWLLSDEVYEHLTYDGRTHHTALGYAGLRNRTLATFSFGKTFHNTGWKVGYIVAPPELTREVRKVHQFNVFSVHHPVQEALASFLQNPEEYTSLPDFYQKKRDVFQQAMQKNKFQALECQGTYFALYSYAHLSDLPDFEFCSQLVEKVGVAAIPVSAFFSDSKDEKVIRFCFAKTEELLLDAVNRLERW